MMSKASVYLGSSTIAEPLTAVLNDDAKDLSMRLRPKMLARSSSTIMSEPDLLNSLTMRKKFLVADAATGIKLASSSCNAN
jgi:hypothetical protein